MRLRASAAGLVPIVSRPAPAEPARRNWLKRLGAVLTGTAVAAPALAASPRQVTGSQPYIGEVMLFAGNFAPQGWAFCDGSLLSIAQYDTLFNLIGTTYGGDGQNTFAVPDLRGRAPRHMGQGPGLSSYGIGQTGGAETATMAVAQMPAHSHQAPASTAATTASPVGAYSAALTATDVNGEAVNALAYGPAAALTNASFIQVQPTGGSQPIAIMPPSLAMNYCISLFGVFPSQ
ncbi:tail fiber protein [Hymenobacter sp. 5317J-9]|uniref:phage tail protein n=1 Tax=Hymenobacter sp. 5317J-9 TaxID=2932250 RepID=UPI001FD6D0C5|nr:tail fiber protein [Hymenobacter sp. 5317J-9]UOQ96462.1 tail fiber protein [Hymenobacter sp. 5317J-9]